MWAKWGQSKTKCRSFPNALVPHKVQHHPKLQCDRAYTHACGEAGADGGPAQSAANETPCDISKFSATLQCSWGVPNRRGRCDLQDEKTSGDMRIASPLRQGKIEGPRAQHQRQPAAASEKPVAAHQAARDSSFKGTCTDCKADQYIL